MVKLHFASRRKSKLLLTLDSFSFQSASTFLDTFKKPIKIKVETLLLQNPRLNETDLFGDNYRVTKKIPKQMFQKTKLSLTINNILLEIQHQHFYDSHDLYTLIYTTP